ncbi:relaxase/mobilization nuclease domain-containing protein [Rhizobium sp. YTU87027]|uniref:relaxase/mobilization nuclease domain-containing protein n=1 Tax=Rhizobium sp. YTU87027 TaxID=3417741 RepID=UPI003D69EBE8
MEIFLGAFTQEWERRRAAFLHERLIASTTDDEELRRRRGSTVLFGAADQNPLKSFKKFAHWPLAQSSPSQRRPMETRFAGLASGSQPAVVKMASFGAASRLGAMAGYISRNGEVSMETQSGQELRGRDAIAALSDDWAPMMGNRAESRDIGIFCIDIAHGPEEAQAMNNRARFIVKSALGDRSFAFGVADCGRTHRIEGVAVLRAKDGERLTADAKATEIVQTRMTRAGVDATEAEFRFTGYGNGVEYGSARLRTLVARFDGTVETDRGEKIGDAKQAGDLVQQEWRGELHSRKSRDVMHLVMSARAGTDVEAFRASARAFLAAEFAEHRYVFSLHEPTSDPKAGRDGGKRPHVHLHAIVAMRAENGDRIETSIASFRRWRENLAEQARARGIRMEMTDRRDQAGAPAYSRNQVRPVSHKGRTEYAGTSGFAALRYEQKRREVPTAARTARSLDYTERVRSQWLEVARDAENVKAKNFAETQLSRIDAAGRLLEKLPRTPDIPHDNGSKIQAALVGLSKLAEVENMHTMTRSEFEAYEKRVEATLEEAERLLPETWRSRFGEIVSAVRDHVDARREMMEQAEQAGERTSETVRPRQADEINQQGEDSIARHTPTAVEAGRDLMMAVEYYRERIESAGDDRSRADKAKWQASLDFELARAGELGAAGNTYIREIAEGDNQLRFAIEAAAQRSAEGTGKTAGGAVQRHHTKDAESEMQDREPKSEALRQTDRTRSAADIRTDPAKQRVSRLDELLSESERSRDRDEFER